MQAVADETQSHSAPFRTEALGVGERNVVPVLSSQVFISLISAPSRETLPLRWSFPEDLMSIQLMTQNPPHSQSLIPPGNTVVFKIKIA